MRNITTGIPYHVEEAVTIFLLKTLTSPQKVVNNSLLADLQSLFERIVNGVVM